MSKSQFKACFKEVCDKWNIKAAQDFGVNRNLAHYY